MHTGRHFTWTPYPGKGMLPPLRDPGGDEVFPPQPRIELGRHENSRRLAAGGPARAAPDPDSNRIIPP